MGSILRTIVFRSNYGGLRGEGIFQSLLGSQKLSSFVPNLFLNSLMKCSSVNLSQRQASSFYDFKHALMHKSKRISEFEQLKFLEIDPSETREGVIINTFQKIYKIFERNRHRNKLQSEFKQFTSSKVLNDLCKAVDKALPTLSPGSLLILLELENFKGPAAHLMPKLCHLLLDCFDRLSLLEIVYLYVRCAEVKLGNNLHWKNINKACEVYFKERFNLDLINHDISEELLNILDLEVLPESVRKAVAMKLLNDSSSYKYNHQEMSALVHSLCNKGYNLVPSSEILRLIKTCSYSFFSGSLLMNLCNSYITLLKKDDRFYDQEILNQLVNAGFKRQYSSHLKIKFIYLFSLLGYYDKELVTFACNFLGTVATPSLRGRVLLEVATIMAQYSFHETEPEGDVRISKKLLNEIRFFEKLKSFPEICAACEFLTYLGCDTRNLCTEIFKTVMASATPVLEKNILTLHHLAKAYHSNGYQVLPEELVKVLLVDEFRRIKFFSPESLAPYFGSEDYVLQNCTTADNHCLHFVSLFGANNKPISLSNYKKKQSKLPYSQFLKIEDIQRPPGSKMVAFQIFPKGQPIKFLNHPSLTGIAKMYLKTFENVDCSIVFIPEKFFKFAPEAREEFLRTQINEVIENWESMQSTG